MQRRPAQEPRPPGSGRGEERCVCRRQAAGKGAQELSPRPPPGGALHPPAPTGQAGVGAGRSEHELKASRPRRGLGCRPAAAGGGAAGPGGRGAEEVPSSPPPAPRGPRCRPGRGAATRGPGARGGRGSRRSRSCSAAGSRSGGDTTRSSCSSSSTWSPFMKNLLLGLSRCQSDTSGFVTSLCLCGNLLSRVSVP
ncbi:retinitis pigmentosa 9 protein isoform X3 [Myotis daubentonii]|uniref:retinitis pigmentosa 9 protein isoform X3 n=1 Tax=Myotis daubentonii TaxID=98922 RepID=UPI002873A330|nr:retinitis pigmentosa 9 protein isoform X3 [Myotis daubentonii]